MFKVGDWVRVFGTPKKIRHIHIYSEEEIEYYDTATPDYRAGMLNPVGMETWSPIEGEWCWFWNSDMNIPVLGKFLQLIDSIYWTTEPTDYEFCEPFVGQLPSIIC